MAAPLQNVRDQPTGATGGAQPPPGASGGSGSSKGTGEVARELWDLLKRYGRQETVDPLKGVGRFLALGVAGSLLLATGVVFLVLGLLRLLQTETDEHLTGSLNWIPYLAALAVAVVLIALAVRGISKAAKRNRRHTEREGNR